MMQMGQLNEIDVVDRVRVGVQYFQHPLLLDLIPKSAVEADAYICLSKMYSCGVEQKP